MDIDEIMQILPHRFPFLLIDRIVDLTVRERIVALKNVTVTEPFFAKASDSELVMPNVLIIEAMAQAGGALLLNEVTDRRTKLVFFTGIEGATFAEPVMAGDQLRVEVVVRGWRTNAVRMKGTAFVENKVVAEATISCQLVDRSRAYAQESIAS